MAVLLCASYLFMHDSKKLVIGPISRIVDSVNRMDKTVSILGGHANESNGMETSMLESIITKMAKLLRIGFGEAGHAVWS